jgi:predicted nucleotidyltransferase
MTSTVFVKFSYEDRVSEEVPIQVELDITNNSNRRKLMNRLLKSNPNITEVTLLS